MTADPAAAESFRRLLCQLGTFIRERVLAARDRAAEGALAAIAAQTAADIIYAVDRISEHAITEWFAAHWPADQPVEVVMEGLEDGPPLVFPTGTPPAQTAWKCILDPIDGTRNLMTDKRSAWVLAAIAPQRGPDTSLADLFVAAMTELPPSRQVRSDQLSAFRGGPLQTTACDHPGAPERPMRLHPSRATDLTHGFASFVKFFPEGKTLLARAEEALVERLYGIGRVAAPLVFDDQYISTGGQFHELLAGHDRFIADLRPLAFAKLGLERALVCHPYDVCPALLLEAGGCLIEAPDGQPLDAPLDTTSPVAWVAYANPALAAHIRPALHEVIRTCLL